MNTLISLRIKLLKLLYLNISQSKSYIYYYTLGQSENGLPYIKLFPYL